MATTMVNFNTCCSVPKTESFVSAKPRRNKMIEERHDRSGVSYTLYLDCLGNAHPVYPSIHGDYDSHLESVRNFNLRSDDVLLVGFPKSGNHWLFEIITMIVNESVDYTEHTLGTSIIDGCPLENLDSMTSPRVLVSHLPPLYLPQQIVEKKTKLVLVLRNPKDIMVSFYDFVKAIQICAPYRGTFDDFFHLSLQGLFPHGRWIDHVRQFDSWVEHHPHHPIHIVTYENMKKDSREEIRKLCNFLGKSKISEDQMNTIVEKTTFTNMKNALNAGKLANMKRVFEEGSPGIFRKGIVGDWKHRLSESQNREIERHFRQRGEGSKLAAMAYFYSQKTTEESTARTSE